MSESAPTNIESGDNVRSLQRGLRLLQAMNRFPHASVTQLAQRAEIPRSTAYRLLETLASLGFVRTSSGEGYRLTRAVRTLSDGFIDDGWIEPAWQEMLRLGREIVWPLSLLTPESGTMVVRRATHEFSALSIDYGMVGRRMPMTEVASGRIYLAYCTPEERRLIMALPDAYANRAVPVDTTLLDERLAAIRVRGYDTRVGGVVEKTGGLGVPIFNDDRVIGVLSLIFIASSLDVARVVAQYEAPLKQTAARISAEAVRLMDAPSKVT